MEITNIAKLKLRLRPGAYLRPLPELPFRIRARIEADPGDSIIFFKGGRTRAKVVGAGTARLVELLSEDKNVGEALLAITREMNLAVDDAVRNVAEAVHRLVDDRVLVPATEANDSRAVPIMIGDCIAGNHVLGRIQILEDSALYRVQHDGVIRALKIRTKDSQRRLAQHERETSIYSRVAHASLPCLIEVGETREYWFILMEFVGGTSLRELLTLSYKERTPVRDRCKLAERVLEAYGHLHRSGTLHADVHPGNLMITEDLAVKLVDFGDAWFIGDAPSGACKRIGIEQYMEPEYWESLSMVGPRAPSLLGEQFMIAAVLYEILTGQQYADFPLDLSRVAELVKFGAPLPFSARGVLGLWAVERVVRRALSKHPASRFRDVDEFFTEFVMAARAELGEQEGEQVGVAVAKVAPRIDDVAREYIKNARPGGPIEEGLFGQPLCSAHYGAAGVAATLLRVSNALRDAEALALAGMWAKRADAWSHLSTAFWTEGMTGGKPVGIERSLHFGTLGVRYAQAAVAHAVGDDPACLAAFQAVEEGSPLPLAELSIGAAGEILCLALFTEVLRKIDRGLSERAGALTRSRLHRLSAAAKQYVDLYLANRQEIYLGMAHGLAGMLYTISAGSCAVGLDPLENETFQLVLAEFEKSIRMDSYHHLRYARTSKSNEVWTGWCNGLAGHMQLWTELSSQLRSDRYIEYALEVEHTLRGRVDTNGTLCCGGVGIAYAYLALFRATRQSGYLDRACELGSDIRGLSSPGLYKGYSGLMCLLADMRNPERSRMPFVEDYVPWD